jgi:hypothetical protein
VRKTRKEANQGGKVKNERYVAASTRLVDDRITCFPPILPRLKGAEIASGYEAIIFLSSPTGYYSESLSLNWLHIQQGEKQIGLTKLDLTVTVGAVRLLRGVQEFRT